MIRDWLARVFLATGLWLCRGPTQHVMTRLMGAVPGITNEIKFGRTGGLMMAGWAIDEEGREMASRLEAAALAACAETRMRVELEKGVSRGQ